MKVRERVGQLNRLQKTRLFKIVASVVVLALGVALGVTYVVSRAAAGEAVFAPAAESSAAPGASATPPSKPESEMTPEEREEAAFIKGLENARKETEKAVDLIRERQADPTAVSVAIGIASLLCIAVIWTGHGLTALLFVVVLMAVCWPLRYFGIWVIINNPDRARLGFFMLDSAAFIGAVGLLGFAFVVLMELLRMALSGSWAVTAIARNVVNEAVRMKISLIFIVMLILGLAALPGLLDGGSPLRYRMQAFLQYGVGGAFWIIAILVLFLSVGSVAFEQRDKIIWQTMTKPVSPWQYLLGKWLGVIGIAAVLLAVSSSGIFLFAEYLRNQPALGEVRAFEAQQGRMSEDRFVLENQVMVARRAVTPRIPALEPEVERREMQERIDRIRAADPSWLPTDENIAAARSTFLDERRTAFFTIEGGNRETFIFRGLEEAKKRSQPVTLRFKVDVGANDPRETSRISFEMANAFPIVREVPGGQTMTLMVSPASIDEKGNLRVDITNGDLLKRLQNADPRAWANTESMIFPPDGLEVAFTVGSYRMNFVRVILVLWIKLAFLAMVSICAATFLSFSVASMVAFGVFIVAESAGFLSNSLEYFSSTDLKGNIEVWKVIVRLIAVPVASTFKVYADLRPTANLVDGRLLPWDVVIRSVMVLGTLTAILFAIAVSIFRKRELATYSGQ